METFNQKMKYLFEEDRIASFKNWKFSANESCNITAMAAAGFYKISDGYGDDCACFFCGKTLDEWAADDNPFLEHKSHSPSCRFVNLGRPQGELKVSEFLDLIEAFMIKGLDEAEEIEKTQRATVFQNAMNRFRNLGKK